ncbi:MAG: protein kinase [Verrucomicrobiales bacterium]|nr:protein kinase [Verrucomicrobiales bacterium]
MDPNEIFLNALEIGSPENRAAYLNQVCQGNPELRGAVESLLRSAAEADVFFGTHDGRLQKEDWFGSCERAESLIGRYRLEEQIGEGGMGTVYRATQMEPVRRSVALKVIKVGMDTRQVIARFRAEQQTLALMDHPHISRVIDAGSTVTGRPYFVMDLVKGLRITDHCDRRCLPVRARLRLFVLVCHAVQHAHQKGVIHRDLKPSNILVTEATDENPEGTPRVIDFGVAKALEEGVSGEESLHTRLSLAGTPAYMSPEQALGDRASIDTRTDVYSLGVLLHELLTGHLPRDRDPKVAQQVGVPKVVRDPWTPSQLLKRLDQKVLAEIAGARATEPDELMSHLRGDLDCIIAKCLQQDHTKRYSTANGLSRDIERHLNHELVEARPPSKRDALVKIYQRHRVLVISVATTVVLLMVAMVASIRWAIRATRAEASEARSRKAAESAADIATRNLYLAQMSQAHVLWDQKEFDRLRRLLLETSTSSHRGFEWYYWMRMAHLEMATLRGHMESIVPMAVSTDGRQLASGDGMGRLRLWEARTGRLLKVFDAIKEPLKSLAFTVDDRFLLVGDLAGFIHKVDLNLGSIIQKIPAHTARISAQARSADGSFLLTAGFDGCVKSWHLPSLSPDTVYSSQGEPYNAAAVSPDGEWIAASGYDQKVHLWRRGRPDTERVLEQTGDSEMQVCLAFSPDSQTLAAGDRAGTLRCWDVASGDLARSQRVHGTALHAVVYLNEGSVLATTGADRSICLWDAATGRKLSTLLGHSGAINALCVQPAGDLLYSGSSDSTIKIWSLQEQDLSHSGPFFEFTGHGFWVYGLHFLPDHRRLLSHVNGAWIWDASTGTERGRLANSDQLILDAAVSPDGKKVVTASEDGVLRLWDVDTRSLLIQFKGSETKTRIVRFHPDSRRILAGDDAGGLKLLWCTDGSIAFEFQRQEGSVREGAFSIQGDLLLTSADGGSVKLWGVSGRSWVETRQFSAQRVPPGSLEFNPTGTRFLSADTVEKTLQVTEVKSGSPVFRRHLTLVPLHRARFSPDGRRILIISESSTGELLDAESGREILSLRGETEIHRAGAFSSDGAQIALGTLGIAQDHRVRIWTAAHPKQAADWLEVDRPWLQDN